MDTKEPLYPETKKKPRWGRQGQWGKSKVENNRELAIAIEYEAAKTILERNISEYAPDVFHPFSQIRYVKQE